MNKDIRKIAKAMGAQFTTISDGSWAIVNLPNGRADWNPLTSHDDCHALIEWLRSDRGCAFVVGHYDIDTVTLYEYTDEVPDELLHRWKGVDYRIGVVELTLKILDESDE